MSDPARPDLNGFKAGAANVCYDCGDTLRGSDGGYAERLVDTGRTAFAAMICYDCKRKHQEAEQRANDSGPTPTRTTPGRSKPRRSFVASLGKTVTVPDRV